jgi:hypothetical protein
MATITCTGFAFLVAHLTCAVPAAAPTGTASFCKVMEQAGGKIRPSRSDTRETKAHANLLNAAYDRDCPKGRTDGPR